MTAHKKMTALGARRIASLLLTGALIWSFAQLTAARAEPLLREQIKVYSDIVTLGDLFENAGDAERAPVFRSPELGTRGVVAAKRVM
ncbi:MAG: hypothetical protein AAGF14_06840, partial [Pseudomonadota bacterium]